MPDHAHILIGANPAISLSDTIQVLKTKTTNFIIDRRVPGHKEKPAKVRTGHNGPTSGTTAPKTLLLRVRREPVGQNGNGRAHCLQAHPTIRGPGKGPAAKHALAQKTIWPTSCPALRHRAGSCLP